MTSHTSSASHVDATLIGSPASLNVPYRHVLHTVPSEYSFLAHVFQLQVVSGPSGSSPGVLCLPVGQDTQALFTTFSFS